MRAFRDREDDELKALFAGRIKVGGRKREILPRSKAQLTYLKMLRSRDVVFGVGPAGTGKTYLAMAVAVSELLAGNCNRIVLTRPAKEAGENLGFLPGSLEEKIMPYLRPLYDALYDMLDFSEAANLIERNVIEVAPLAFMRGRTLNHAFIILDEAQNTTEEQMLMFLTRLGYRSRCVITGDPSQSDLGRHERSGLKHGLLTLRDIPEIGIVEFSTRDVVRHALLEKIIHAYHTGRES
ncbi:PhoH-like protein [bioreactor metagenome]|uniref:PhoH-like protein n=1 Tax=bioreactor metagenome TaxID=1076179 RepID=A0A645G8W5_9ZZZZ